MKIYLVVKACLINLLWLTCSAQAQNLIIKPHRDITSIKLEDVEVALVNTVVDMNNAHSIEIISFFVPNSKGIATQLTFEMNNDYVPYLALRSGADCAISGARILRFDNHLRVVFATRKGDWSEKKQTEFTIFELNKNDGSMPGTPNTYFKQLKKINTKSSYCDVNAALDKESKLYQ